MPPPLSVTRAPLSRLPPAPSRAFSEKSPYNKPMELQYTYWQDGAFFVGFLNDYPDDSTQGFSVAELEEALVEVYEIKQEEKEHLAAIRKTGRIKIPA
jgi:hypothetical protein